MHHENCKCWHHWVEKIIAALVWVAGVLFFWTSWRGVAVWGFEPLYYAWSAIVLSLMAFSMKFCGCRRKMMTSEGIMSGGTCRHSMECKCQDCDHCK